MKGFDWKCRLSLIIPLAFMKISKFSIAASIILWTAQAVPAFAGSGKVIKPIKQAPRPQTPPAQLLSSPVEISLVTPIQIAGPESAVSGFRLNLIYGTNANVRGLDVGVVNDSAGDGCGLELGVSNSVGGKYSGIQAALSNFVKSDFGGLQAASLNVVQGTVKGGQIGMVNCAERLGGIQVGVFNVAGSMQGIQIGLINVSRREGGLPFCPVINVAF